MFLNDSSGMLQLEIQQLFLPRELRPLPYLLLYGNTCGCGAASITAMELFFSPCVIIPLSTHAENQD